MFLKGEQISAHSSFTLHNLQPQPGYWLLDRDKLNVNKLSNALNLLIEFPIYQRLCYQKFSAGMPQLSLRPTEQKWIYENIKQK